MNRLRMAVLAVGLAAVPVSAASPDPKDLVVPAGELSKARELVHKLGSEAFQEREKATDDLAKMGRLAKVALAEALTTDPNPEVRSRTARLLPRAEAADLQARIDTFLADTDAKFKHDMPGWSVFRKEVGGTDAAADKAARELYVEAIKETANLDLLTALGGSAEAAGRAIADRRIGLFLEQNPGAFGRGFAPAMPTKPRQPTLADIAVLLLAETVVPGKDIPRNAQFGHITAAQFIQQAPSMNAVNNPDGTTHGRAYRQLFVKWLDTRTTPEDLQVLPYMAANFRTVKEFGPLLRRIVTTEGVMGYSKGQALVYLAQRNGKEEEPFLKAQLKNDTAVNPVFLGVNPMGGQLQATCQIRDMALALLVTQAGQSIKDYHFTTAPGNIPNPVQNPYPTYAFMADEDRAKAFKKWAEFEAKKKAEPKKDEKK